MSLLGRLFGRKPSPKRLDGEVAPVRSDGWISALTGFGGPKDRRESAHGALRFIDSQTAETLWRSDDIAARIVETIPNESLRSGFEINLEDKEVSEKVMSRVEDLRVVPSFLRAMYFARAYGGGAIWPVINDGEKDLSKPLNLDRIPRIEHLLVFEGPRELTPVSYYTGIDSPKLGRPEIYTLSPRSSGGGGVTTTGQAIHESRLIVFDGIRVGRGQTGRQNGWGDSVFSRVYEVLRDYGIAWSSAAVLLHEFSQASFKIKGLANLLAKDRDQAIVKRIQAVELARSTINAVLMDSEEEYERKQTPVAGLKELLDGFGQRVSAAANMPTTLLMSVSPGGLNATGESDIRFFYDRVDVDRTLFVKPLLEQMIQVILRSKEGPTGGVEPEVWSVSFNPLWQESDQDQAATRKTIAETDNIYVQMQAVTPEEIAVSRFGGDTYSAETVLMDEEDQAPDEETSDEEISDEEIRPEEEVVNEAVDVQKSAMNGAQVASLVNVVSQVNTQIISRESGVAILRVAFQLSADEADRVIGAPPDGTEDDAEDDRESVEDNPSTIGIFRDEEE